MLQSLRDLQFQEVVIGSDLGDLVEAIKRPADWPRYRWLLKQVLELTTAFPIVCFEIESKTSNHVAREIAKSVLRNGLFRYLSLEARPGYSTASIKKVRFKLFSLSFKTEVFNVFSCYFCFVLLNLQLFLDVKKNI